MRQHLNDNNSCDNIDFYTIDGLACKLCNSAAPDYARLKEYLEDYASEKTKDLGYELIAKEVEKITNEKVKAIAIQNIDAIRNNNRRDFYF